MKGLFFLFDEGYKGVAYQGAMFLLFVLVVALIGYGLLYVINALAPDGLKKPLIVAVVIVGIIFLLFYLAGSMPNLR